MTPAMQKFVEHNARHLIVKAERLTPARRIPYNAADIVASDRCRYHFEDGSYITLKDIDKIIAPDFTPEWSGV